MLPPSKLRFPGPLCQTTLRCLSHPWRLALQQFTPTTPTGTLLLSRLMYSPSRESQTRFLAGTLLLRSCNPKRSEIVPLPAKVRYQLAIFYLWYITEGPHVTDYAYHEPIIHALHQQGHTQDLSVPTLHYSVLKACAFRLPATRSQIYYVYSTIKTSKKPYNLNRNLATQTGEYIQMHRYNLHGHAEIQRLIFLLCI